MDSLTLYCPSMGCQYGGTETYVQTLASSLQSSIKELRLVTGGAEKHFSKDYSSLLQQGNIKNHTFPLLSRHSSMGKALVWSGLDSKICPTDLESLSALLSWRKIGKFIEGSQIVEAHYPLDGLLFPLFAKDCKKILHFHGAWPPPLFRKLSKFILRHTDGCVACSSFAKQELEKIMAGAEIEVIYNGVDTSQFFPGQSGFDPGCDYDKDSLKVGTVGRLSHYKGTNLLCDVVREMGGAIELFLAGPADTAFDRELEKLADVANIHVLGPLPHGEIADFYRFLDCFVLPSQFEAFPLTILEAMASGCIVLASDVGGIPEMLPPDQEVGMLFSRDDGSTLKKYLHKIVEDRAGFYGFKKRARSRVVNSFSLKKTTTDMLNYYTRQLER